MSKKELQKNIKETKELIKYSQKMMDSMSVQELKEDLLYYQAELKKL